MRRSSASTPPGPKSRSAGVRSGLQRRLDDVEAGLAALAAGQGRPEDAQAALDLLRDLRDRLPDRRPRRPAADQDRAADQRYRSLFDNASDAILIVAPDGRIRDANKAACQQLGYDRAHLLRRQPADLTSPELRPALGGYLQTVLGQGQATFETRFLTAAGRRLPGEVTAKRIEGESGPEILCVIRDTTRRSQAIAAMESQYAFIQTLMETAPAPIFFKDIDGAYLGCNRAFEELMGLPRHEIVGHTVRSIAPPDLAAEYEAHDRELLLHPGRVVYETRVLTDHGSRERHALVNKATYPDASGQVAGIVGIILDITEHKRVEEALYASRQDLERRVVERTSELMSAYSRLAESERTYRTLYEQAAEAILLLDAEGRVLESNPAARALLAPDGQTLSGRGLPEFMPGAEGLAETLLAQTAERGAAREELRVRSLRGDEAFTDASFSSLGENLLLVMLRDITERRRMEEALVRAKIGAEDANQAKSEFVANISHELRTPIAGIFGMTDMALASQPDDQVRHCLSQIRTAATALLDIVNDILDFSKIEARRLELRPMDFDLWERLKRLREEFLPAARDKGLALRFPEAGRPWRLRGDPGRLAQVLSNLLSNAIKFTAHGSVSLEVRRPDHDETTVEFTVRDTGIGIPASKMGLLFQTFTQLEPGLSRRWGGTGLGLVISKRLVELMGGTIRVESEPKVGSAFRFTLRFAPADAAEPPAEVEAPAEEAASCAYAAATERTAPPPPAEPEVRPGPAAERGEPRRILLAEDNLLNQEFLTHFLKEAGHRPRVVGSGIEALQALAQEPFDLVLMDVQMPEMDGLEATRRIRSHDGSAFDPHVPVVALTAYAMKGDRERLLTAGMDEYLSKPVDIPELYAVIDRLTAPGHASRPRPAEAQA